MTTHKLGTNLDTYDTFLEVENQAETIEELHEVEKAEKTIQHDIDKQYADAMFWRNISNILAEARETTDNSIEGAITSSAHYL